MKNPYAGLSNGELDILARFYINELNYKLARHAGRPVLDALQILELIARAYMYKRGMDDAAIDAVADDLREQRAKPTPPELPL